MKYANSKGSKNVKEEITLTPKKILKGIVGGALFLGMAVGLAYLLLQIGGHEMNEKLAQIKANEDTAECVIIKSGNMKGNYVTAEFSVNGSRYQITEGATSRDIIPGQRFKLRFDSTNPSKATIIFEEPFFPDGAQTEQTSGEIVQVDSRTIRFEYMAANEQRMRFQDYPQGKIFSVGETYAVEYFIADPRIAIMKLP